MIAINVGDLVKIASVAGMFRVEEISGKAMKACKAFADGSKGALKDFDVRDVAYNAGPKQSSDDGKIPVALSFSSQRLERQLQRERKESEPERVFVGVETDEGVVYVETFEGDTIFDLRSRV